MTLLVDRAKREVRRTGYTRARSGGVETGSANWIGRRRTVHGRKRHDRLIGAARRYCVGEAACRHIGDRGMDVVTTRCVSRLRRGSVRQCSGRYGERAGKVATGKGNRVV